MNQGAVWNTIQVALDVCIDHEVMPLVPRCADRLHGLRRALFRTESETARLEIRFEDRLDHDLRRHLHHPVPHRQYPQWPLLSVSFRYVLPPHPVRGYIG